MYMQEAKYAEEVKFQQQREESLRKVNMELGKLPVSKDGEEQTKVTNSSSYYSPPPPPRLLLLLVSYTCRRELNDQ